MAAHRKKNKQTLIILVKVFGILVICMALFVGFRYYRRQAIQQEQIRQEQQAQKEAAEKLERQRKQFIKTIAPVAQKVDKSYDLLPSITIAQACLESNYGQSQLAQKYNNLFGVKSSNK